MIRFVPLPGRPADWDEVVRAYPGKTLFHESAWLDHVLDIHPDGRIACFDIVRDGERVGVHCGLRITRMMVPIHGSPLGGTGTNWMGPLVREGIEMREVIDALVRLSGPRHFLHLELGHPSLEQGMMAEMGFQVQDGVTHLVPVPPSPGEAWAALRGEARNRVRKAEKGGVVVERTDDPAIVDHFYDQFGEVYGKQGMVRPFGIERPRSLFERLTPAGRLLPLWARKDGEVLAAGLFPYDARCIYFWGAASWLRHQHLCPNEALHWEVIRFAAENGIAAYDMCGGTSQFKNKFGGGDVPHPTFHRSALPFLQTARRIYRDRHFRRLRTAAEPAAQPA
ncbi:MAG TPA: GNAT family N-acetyltransferase [Longimicrobium sp.]